MGRIYTQDYPKIEVIEGFPEDGPPDMVLVKCLTRHCDNPIEYDFLAMRYPCLETPPPGYDYLSLYFKAKAGHRYMVHTRDYAHALSKATTPQMRVGIHEALVAYGLASGECPGVRYGSTDKEDGWVWEHDAEEGNFCEFDCVEAFGGSPDYIMDTGHTINGCPRTKS